MNSIPRDSLVAVPLPEPQTNGDAPRTRQSSTRTQPNKRRTTSFELFDHTRQLHGITSVNKSVDDRDSSVVGCRAEPAEETMTTKETSTTPSQKYAASKYAASPRRLTGLVLVGSATRMPRVQAFIKHVTGLDPAGGVDPESAVALGAAIHSGVLQVSKEKKRLR